MFMNKIIALASLLGSTAYSSMDMTDFPHEILPKTVAYSLSPLNGFKKLDVTFHLSGGVDNEISSIEIDTGKDVYSIESSRLNIDFAPNLNEINFHRIGDRTAATPIYFNIFYGAPRLVECGVEGKIYMQKAVKITIFPANEPTVERDSSFFDSCKRSTELEAGRAKEHNQARHGDVFSVPASPPLQSRACWQR